MVYDVEFPDGSICKKWSNVIANNMYYQVDSEGFLQSILFVILDISKIQPPSRKVINISLPIQANVVCENQLLYVTY